MKQIIISPEQGSVAVSDSNELALASAPAPLIGLVGDFSLTSSDLPSLRQVHPLDHAVTEFSARPGNWMIQSGKDDPFELAKPFEIAFVSIKKGYIEIAKNGEIPNILWSKEEVRNQGGGFEYNSTPRYADYGDAFGFISPDATEVSKLNHPSLLNVRVSKKFWLPVRYKAKNTAYNAVCGTVAKYQILRTAPAGKPLQASVWLVTSETKENSYNGSKYLVPHLTFVRESSAEEVALLKA